MGAVPLDLVAVATGRVVPIEAVPDPAFSERMLGDGIAIEPEAPVIAAPCAGRVEQVHRSRHAYGIAAPGGARVLVHVGIETVALKGEGFKPRVEVGEEVRAGQPLVEIDRAVLLRHGANPLTIMVVENSDEHPVSWRAAPGRPVCRGADVVLRLGGDGAAPRESTRAGEAAGPGAGEGAAAAEAASPGRPRSGGHETAAGRATVRQRAGLHARPAARVAAAARRFRGDVELLAHGQSANARSVTALMGLGVEEGESVEVVATGLDAAAARDAVIAALESDAEGPRAAAAGPPPPQPAVPAATLDTCDLAGVIASRGLAVGRIHHLRQTAAEVPEEGRGAAVELPELQRALREAARDVDGELDQARRRGGDEIGILEAHRALIEDPELFYRASAIIGAGSGKSAAHAWSTAVREQCDVLTRTGSALLAERTADLRDVERRVLLRLIGRAAPAPDLPQGAIVLAEDLSPGELATLDRTRLAGLVTHRGGPTSHVAIVARSQGIPALVAAGPGLRMVPDGAEAVLDARSGILCWRPTAGRLAEVRAELARAEARQAEARAAARQPAVTVDGARIEVAANVGSVPEAERAAAAGADGVGLLRTELVFLEREVAPTVDEQRVAYQAVLDALPRGTVIVRTLDVGADKSLAYVPQPREDNPALGLRGVRLGLARKELLADQLRAVLSVRPLERVRIMLPMVTDGEDVAQARELLGLAAAELGVAPPPLGVMIETPAAAVLADQLAAHADFFSIGTNDLTQYTLAMDRGNAAVAARLDDLHPAVLRMVARTVEGAIVHGRPVGVCGAAASDPLGAALLVGLGVAELSVSVATLAEVKQAVRRLDRRACAELARQALTLGSGQAVRAHVRNALPWLDGAGP